MGVIDELKEIFMDKDGGKNSSLLRNIIILGMIGTLLLLFANLFFDANQESSPINYTETREERYQEQSLSFEAKLARELEEIISLIRGVGDSKVLIYARNQSEYDYEYNTKMINKITNETDQSGGQREILEDNQDRQLLVLRDSSGNEEALIRRKSLPEITAVFIVAEGAENSLVKYQITRAIANLLDLAIHKISVLPYEGR